MNYLATIFKSKNYNLRNFTAFLIIIMCLQYIPIESRAGVSMVKVFVMGIIVPFVLMANFRITKAMFIGVIYLLYIFFTSSIYNSTSFRLSTVIYLSMFVITYITFYTLVYSKHVFTIDIFINFVKKLIYVLVIVLIIQQSFIVIGVKLFPLINLCQILDRVIGANSLTYEPSTLARVLLILYYAYLKCNEYRQGEIVNIKQIFSPDHKWCTIAFLWAMLTMGSGTAFICLGVLSLYFLRGYYMFLAIPIFVGIYFTLSYIELESFERATNVIEATTTGESKKVAETDGSASTRINPLLNTFNADFSDPKIWFGEGCDTGINYGINSSKRYYGSINDYGLIAIILELVLIFSCAIRFRSLATIMFILGIGGGVGNIPYQWGLLLILTAVRYFHDNRYNLEYDEFPVVK